MLSCTHTNTHTHTHTQTHTLHICSVKYTKVNARQTLKLVLCSYGNTATALQNIAAFTVGVSQIGAVDYMWSL